MTIQPTDISDLKGMLSDRLYLQVANWHLYLGDAGLVEPLASECIARLDKGAAVAAKEALEAVPVPIAGGTIKLSLSQLVPTSQFHELEEILAPYCR